MGEQVRIGQKRNSRPTIGFFTLEWEQQGGQAFEVWQGMIAAAQAYDVNLICFAGSGLHGWRQSHSGRQILAHLATPDLLDGVLTFEWWSSREAFEQFYKDFRPLPVVNVMRLFEGYPGVGIDNYQDMLMLMSHLIEVHGCRRIGYTNGWADTPTQETRYRAYRDALSKYGIPFDAALVVPRGDPGPGGHGERLVRYMMDEQGLTPGSGFDAIVGFNDDQALEALRALQARNVRVPQDVAVMGIDDIPAAQVAIPPLSTLSTPRYEMGYRAVELLLAQIQGEQVPMQTVLPSRLVLRRSCGCLPVYVREAGVIPLQTGRRTAEQSFETAWTRQRASVLAEMVEAVQAESIGPIDRWAEQLLDAFYAQITGMATDSFLPLLDDLLRREIENARPVLPWQLVLLSLRRYVLRCLADTDNEVLYRAEALLGQGRALLHEMERLAQAQMQRRILEQSELLRNMGQTLTTVTTLEALLDELVRWLPRLGIEQCYLAVYQDPSAPERRARLLLAYEGGRRIELQGDDALFASSQLMPASAWPVDRCYALDVEPLYFQQMQEGLVILGTGVKEWQVYESLRAQLSDALYSVLLIEDYERANQALAREQYFMQVLMDNLPEHIYFKDVASRFVRISRSLAQSFGLDDPATAVGKSDTDFFTEEHARSAYEMEQQIIKTGKPILNLEERETWPDRPETWALTSKFPLRSEQGNIIGTFGISRDITLQKQAELALQSAYRDAERRAFLLQTVTELSTIVSSLIDFDVLAQRVVDLAQERFGLYYVGLFLVEETEEGKWAVLYAGTGEAGKKMVADGHRLEVGGHSMIGRCILTAQAEIRQRVDEADVRFVNPLLPDTRAEMALPLISRGQVIGALTIQSAQEGAFSEEDIAVFQSMANQVANAIANARLVETVQARLRETEILEEVSRAVSSMLNLDYTLDAAVHVLADEMAFTYIAINLIDRAANVMRTPRGFGLAASLNGLVRPLEGLQNDILMDIARKQEIEVIDGWDDRFDREIWEKGGHQNLVRAYVPLVIRGETIGILEVGYDRRERPRITPEEVRLLRSIAERVAVAVENARLLDETRAYASQQASIAEISARMQQATDIESLMQITSQELSRVLNAARVYVRLGTPVLPGGQTLEESEV